MLKHDDINIAKDFWPLSTRQIANSLDFVEFWQIILYLAFFAEIRWHILFFFLFLIITCIRFFIRKKINFLSNSSFLICKMYIFDQYFWLEITNSCTFCVNFCAMTSYLYTQLTDLSFLVFVTIQGLDKWEYENMKIKQNCWQRWVWCVQHHFFSRKITQYGDLLFLLACWIQH